MSFDFQCRLLFSDDPELVIQTPFRLITGANETTIDPEDTTAVAPVLGLLHAELQAMIVGEDGELTAEFTSGVRIIVAPHELYEAWQITHPDGRMAFAVPGGGLNGVPAMKPQAPST